jgi:VNT family MFS transporter (synaptic vesicle glycoprotein 2)
MPPEGGEEEARTLDDYLQAAVQEDSRPHPPWRYWWIFISLGVANSSDATEILCLSYILSDDTFRNEFLDESSTLGGLAAAVFFGMLLGGLWVGSAGDVYGRRPILLVGCFVNATAGCLAALTSHQYILTACRFVAGLGIGATVPPLFTLCSELAPPATRGFWVAVVASFWMVGSIFVAIVGWFLFSLTSVPGIPNWRLFMLACALPSLMGGLLVATSVPESPRFLALQGRHGQAVFVTQGLGHRLLYTGPSWTLAEALQQFPPRRRSSNASETRTIAGATMGQEALMEFYHSARRLYTKELLSSTWGLQIVWFSLSFGSYGLTTWINRLFEQVHLHNIYFNALLFALSNLPGNLLSAYFLDKWGRQFMLTGSMVAASLSLLVFAYVAASDAATMQHREGLIVTAACAFQAFTIAAWNTIDVMTAEAFPTTVRSTGVAVCAATGRVAAMCAQVVNGYTVAQPARLLSIAATALGMGAFIPRLLIPDRTGLVVLDQVPADEQAFAENEEARGFLAVGDDHHDGAYPAVGTTYQGEPA